MINYGTLLGALVPVFLVIAAGALARFLNLLPVETEQPFMRLNLRLLYPCLVLSYTLGNRALMTVGGLLTAPLLGFGITAATMLAALAFGRSLGLPSVSRRTFAFVTGTNNYGYLPVPLCTLLFDDATTGVLLVFGAGVEAAMWTVGVMMLSGHLEAKQLRKLLNPPVISLAAAVALNLTGIVRFIPDPVIGALHMIGATAIPFGLLLIGAVLFDLTKQIDWLENKRAPLTGLALRLGLFPIALLIVAAFLPANLREARCVLVLEAAMPCGIFPIVITKYYQGDTPLALRVVLITTLAGVFLIPLWLAFGLHLFGLD